MALSTSTMRASLGNVAAFAPLRPAVRRTRVVAPVRAEKSLGDKIQEKTDVRIRSTPPMSCALLLIATGRDNMPGNFGCPLLLRVVI